MPGLPPRAREVDVDGGDARGGDEIAEDDLRIAAAGFDVRQFTDRDPGRGKELVPAIDFDPEVVSIGVRRRGGEEEQALPEADFDLDRVRITEEVWPGDGIRRPGCIQ